MKKNRLICVMTAIVMILSIMSAGVITVSAAADIKSAAISNPQKNMVGDTLIATFEENTDGSNDPNDYTFTWVSMETSFAKYAAGYTGYNDMFFNATALQLGSATMTTLLTGAGETSYTITKEDIGKVIRVKVSDGAKTVYAPQIVIPGNMLYKDFQKNGVGVSNVAVSGNGSNPANNYSKANDGLPDVDSGSTSRVLFYGDTDGSKDYHILYKFTSPVYIDTVKILINGTLSKVTVQYMTDSNVASLASFASTDDFVAPPAYDGVNGGTYTISRAAGRVLAYGVKVGIITGGGSPSLVQVAAYDKSANPAVSVINYTGNADIAIDEGVDWTEAVTVACPNLGPLTYNTTYEIDIGDGSGYKPTTGPINTGTAAAGTKFRITYTATQKDYYGNFATDVRAISIVSDREPSADTTIHSIPGLTVGDDTITGLTKGTLASDLIASAITDYATITLLNEADPETTYLFGGETLLVTSENKEETKQYTLTAKKDVYNYDFNDSKLPIETPEEVGVLDNVPGIGEKPGNPLNITKNVFPTGNFTQYFLAAPTSGTAYFAGAISGLKSDRVGEFSVKDYVGAANTNRALSPSIIDNIKDLPKRYALNANIYTSSNSVAGLQFLAGNHNNTTGILSQIEFNYTDNSIRINGQSTAVATYTPNVWYSVSLVVDPIAKKSYIYVNGQSVGTPLDITTFITNWETNTGNNLATNLTYRVSQYHPAGTVEKPITSSVYFDNVSIYEIANVIQPNPIEFVPALSSDIGTFNNVEGTLTLAAVKSAEELTAAITNLPAGYTASVYNSDETEQVTGVFDFWLTHKLVFKNGDFVKSYIIIPAVEFKGAGSGNTIGVGNNSITLSGSLASNTGVFVLAAYKGGSLEYIDVASTPAAKRSLTFNLPSGEDPAEYTINGFVFNSFDDISPVLPKAIIIENLKTDS